MKSFYLTGHKTFGNRGCEAIVRSTVGLLKQQFGDIEVLVPSNDILRDSGQWPDAEVSGVRFVPDYSPSYTRYWVHLQRLPIRSLKQAGWPFPISRELRETFAGVDAVISIGGDNYSLDYRLPSLIMGIDKLAMDMGKPVILWGASVGPFEQEPDFVPAITKHLSRMRLIAVRESVSYRYLTQHLGLGNVMQMADPAFTLSRQAVECELFCPTSSVYGVLGLNVSPLIERYKKAGKDLRKETAAFIRYAVEKKGMGVLLVPHVVPLDGSEFNNDAHYMQSILDEVADLSASVKMMPDHFNAAQIKDVIGHLRFFIGARTHATIAALSSGVPTISIAYSVKAKGINKDIFGTEEPVLQTSDLSNGSLRELLEWLFEEEKELRDILSARIPQLQEAAKQAAKKCAEVVHDR